MHELCLRCGRIAGRMAIDARCSYGARSWFTGDANFTGSHAAGVTLARRMFGRVTAARRRVLCTIFTIDLTLLRGTVAPPTPRSEQLLVC